MGLLDLKNISVRFGGLVAVQDLSLSVAESKISSIIGPNGAGKTTVFNAITGIFPPTDGSIFFSGRDVRAQFSLSTFFKTISAGLLLGILMVVAINIQSVWDAAIIQRFIYGSEFDWSGLLPAAFSSIEGSDYHFTIIPLLIGFLIGSLGYFSVWARGRASPTHSARLGISRTFQNIRLFPQMTVLENILVGSHRRFLLNWIDVIFLTRRLRSVEQREKTRALELINFVGLSEHENDFASNLSYGHQRRVEIARALASDPKLILLDEPAAGMNPSEMNDLMDLITKIQSRGVTVLLIEHHMKLVMGISEHVAVLEYGNKIAEGSPDEVRNNPRVISAY